MQMRSTLLPGQPWDVMVDLFFYREPEETKDPSEEEAADYGGDAQPYGQLPAPGGTLPLHLSYNKLFCDMLSMFALLLCYVKQISNCGARQCLRSRLDFH